MISKEFEGLLVENDINPIGRMIDVDYAVSIVYGLVNTLTNKIFYVGAAQHDLFWSRYKQHLFRSKVLTTTSKQFYIRDVKAQGGEVRPTIIDCLPIRDGKERDAFESLWIGHARYIGLMLFNNDTRYPSQFAESYGKEERYERMTNNEVRQVSFQYQPIQYIKVLRAQHAAGMSVKRICHSFTLYRGQQGRKSA